MTRHQTTGRSRRSFHTLFAAAWFMGLWGYPALGAAEVTGLCNVAREIALKGIGRFDAQRKLAIPAIRRAHDLCPTDPEITFNLGLAWYLDKQLPKARELWETLHQTTKDRPASDRLAMKVHANLAWLRFEMGDDENAHLLAFEGVKKYPGNLALAHTKYMSLSRMARYLEAYDWLTREHLPGSMPREWKQQAAESMVENLWREFRSGKHLSAIKNTVDFLVKEYPEERLFLTAKEQLLVAEIDPKGVIPPPVELPDSVWPKTGNVGDRIQELDPLLAALPSLDPWKKRQDAFALLVGISRYQNIEARHYGDRDASNLYTLLTRRGVFFPDTDHTRLRTGNQATLETIQRDLEWLAHKGRTHPNAILLFYFSGLGAPWVASSPPRFDDGLLLPVQVEGLSINPQTAISLRKIKTLLHDLPDREIAVILDTCFHGQSKCGTRFSGQKVLPSKEFFSDTHGWALASLHGDSGTHDLARQGIFTYELIKGLLGSADGSRGTDQDGWVSLEEAFHAAQARLKPVNPSVDGFLTAPGSIRLTRLRGEQ
ncbi:MAG: caspase family protein [Magnetococcales bacterium]|nr:caspase family protein [Magnetococcales bacterium]MBF0148913.1 caspase family protein [Magnetococcales bacterium]MBF0347599.1 caspase family protein [Magnetococcales bacterium]MBF0630112.1 caspase family protein [Magnetococcales bacterium]